MLSAFRRTIAALVLGTLVVLVLAPGARSGLGPSVTESIELGLLLLPLTLLAFQGVEDIKAWPTGPRRLAVLLGPLSIIISAWLVYPGSHYSGGAHMTARYLLWGIALVLATIAIGSWVRRSAQADGDLPTWRMLRHIHELAGPYKLASGLLLSVGPAVLLLSDVLDSNGTKPAAILWLVTALVFAIAFGSFGNNGLGLLLRLKTSQRAPAALLTVVVALSIGVLFAGVSSEVLSGDGGLPVAIERTLVTAWLPIYLLAASLSLFPLWGWIKDGFSATDSEQDVTPADTSSEPVQPPLDIP